MSKASFGVGDGETISSWGAVGLSVIGEPPRLRRQVVKQRVPDKDDAGFGDDDRSHICRHEGAAGQASATRDRARIAGAARRRSRRRRDRCSSETVCRSATQCSAPSSRRPLFARRGLGDGLSGCHWPAPLRRPDRWGRSCWVDPGRLEGFDVGQPIDDPAADLQVSRPAPLPTPLFERAWRNEPTLRQMLLVKMLHAPVLSCVTRARPIRRAHSRGELGRSGSINLWSAV